MEEIREAFNLFDTEAKGHIDIKELKAAFRALGFQARRCSVARLLAGGARARDCFSRAAARSPMCAGEDPMRHRRRRKKPRHTARARVRAT